jgi:Holliday junction resolvase RusA-like endonuclease
VIDFCAYIRPEPQGSAKAFVRGARAIITSDNRKLRPYRSEVTRCAMAALAESGLPEPAFGKHVPVTLRLEFTLLRPPSISKKRTHVCVRPDIDKMARATLDSLTGVVYHDDAQVVNLHCVKSYGLVEGVRVVAEEVCR